jgi:hypothetical protein
MRVRAAVDRAAGRHLSLLIVPARPSSALTATVGDRGHLQMGPDRAQNVEDGGTMPLAREERTRDHIQGYGRFGSTGRQR